MQLMLFSSNSRSTATILLLLVEEAAVVQITGQRAGFGAAEDAVPPAGYGIVGGVAHQLGQELHEESGSSPEPSKLLKDEDSRGGTREQRFVGQVMVEHHVNRIKVGGADAVAGEDAGGEGALQRGETEDRFAIATENKLDEAVAQSAHAVVEEDGVGHDLGT
jgi:hypothetical protein